MTITRGIAVVTYNRGKYLGKILDAVRSTAPKGCRLVVADDGSTDNTVDVVAECPDYVLLRGSNKGVAHNKNRALFALQDCDFICLLEDDLVPVTMNWFNMYEKAALYSGIHHFCRVQDKQIPECMQSFAADMGQLGMKPIYGPSPRGDFTFMTKLVTATVGGFNPAFKGAGYAHGEWSERVWKADLIQHPAKWVDIRSKKNNDPFEQIGDTEGGRWEKTKDEIKQEIKANRAVRKRLKHQDYLYHPLTLG